MKLFNGKQEAIKLDRVIMSHISKNPVDRKLAIVLVGNEQASVKYVNMKKRLCDRLGITCVIYKLPKKIDYKSLNMKISDITNNEKIGGCVVQLPLPDEELYPVLNNIPYDKDCDRLSGNANYLGDYYNNNDITLLTPVVRSLLYILGWANISIIGSKVTVIGDGKLIGMPIFNYLRSMDVKVNLINDYKPGTYVDSDLVVIGVGIPELLKGNDVKDGAGIIDFGSSVINEKVIGDFDINSKIDHLSFISKSPGGAGPLVVRYLIMNFLGL